MEPSNEEKGKLGCETVQAFLEQFGKPDVYTVILLEELFKILYEEKDSCLKN
jgi:hypothetical protein